MLYVGFNQELFQAGTGANAPLAHVEVQLADAPQRDVFSINPSTPLACGPN